MMTLKKYVSISKTFFYIIKQGKDKNCYFKSFSSSSSNLMRGYHNVSLPVPLRSSGIQGYVFIHPFIIFYYFQNISFFTFWFRNFLHSKKFCDNFTTLFNNLIFFLVTQFCLYIQIK